MTQNAGQRFGVHAAGKGMGGEGVAQVVESDTGQPCVVEQGFHVGVSTAGVDSIKQPVMRRDLERAGTEIYVLPQYKLTYDENGYCVKKEKCRIPDDIAAKLAEMNK